MDFNKVAEKFLQATDVLMEAQQSTFRFDRTIKATIYDIQNLDTGEYRVKYEDAIFLAYSSDLSKQYKIKDAVYVQIPEGNMSGKKFITGLVSGTSLTESQMNQLTNSIIEVSPTIDQLYNDSTIRRRVGIIAADSVDESYYGQQNFSGHKGGAYIVNYTRTQLHGLFRQYAAEYDIIRIKASFMTQFHSQHIKGNYGIEVAFYTKDNQKDEVYRLDFQSFNGSPYRFINPSPQYILIKIIKDYIVGLHYIKFFQEDFNADIHNGQPNLINPNIFVENIQIGFVESKDLTTQPYYCYISAPEGSIIPSTGSNLTLEAKLLSYGQIVEPSRCEYKWYKRDLSISISSEEYDKDAGIGWKLIQGEKKSKLNIKSALILFNQLYKVVVTYQKLYWHQ